MLVVAMSTPPTQPPEPKVEELALAPVAAGEVAEIDNGLPVPTRKQVSRILSREFRKAVPRLAEKFYESLEKGVVKNDPTSMSLAAQVLQLKATGGPVINVNTQVNTNVSAGKGGKKKSFESVLSTIEQRNRAHEDGIIDAEVEEVQ